MPAKVIDSEDHIEVELLVHIWGRDMFCTLDAQMSLKGNGQVQPSKSTVITAQTSGTDNMGHHVSRQEELKC
jgi:hypothetical protein